MEQTITFEVRENAFLNRISTFAIVNRNHIIIREFLEDGFRYFENKLNQILTQHPIVKFGTTFTATYEKLNNENQIIHIYSKNQIVQNTSNLKELYKEHIIERIERKVDVVLIKGSGFSLSAILELVIQVAYYQPLQISSYIELPIHLQRKKAIVNINNSDQKCFQWAILSALHPVLKDANRVTKYKRYSKELKFGTLKFPITLCKITKFEDLNEKISVNVYCFDEKKKIVYPIRLTTKIKEKHVHLLMITEFNELNNTVDSHYCWIKNMSRLFRSQITKYEHVVVFCDRCLNHFCSKQVLQKHYLTCMQQNTCSITMPTKDNNIISFTQIQYQLRVPFIIYADMEALLIKPKHKYCNSEKTIAYQEHQVYSVGYYFKCNYDDSLSFYRSHTGRLSMDWFINEINNRAHDVSKIINDDKLMNITPFEKKEFQRATKCHICNKLFQKCCTKVKDHSHITGQKN